MSFGYGIQQFGIDTTLPVLQNLVVWLDAADENTITIATGISQWDDKSGNGNHFTQTTGGDQPAYVTEVQNGLNVARFDGSTEFIDASSVLITGTTARTSFLVTQYTDDGSSQGFFTMNTVASPTAGEKYQVVRAGGGSLAVQVTSGNIVFSVGDLPTSWTVYSFRNDTGEDIIDTDGRNDGVDMGSTGLTQTINTKVEGATSLGISGNAASFLTGDIGEFVLYDRELSLSETESMENYLLAKWGIAHA